MTFRNHTKKIELKVVEITDADSGEKGYTVSADGRHDIFKIFQTREQAEEVMERWEIINEMYNQ